MLSVSTGTMGATLFRHIAPAVMDMSIMNSTRPPDTFFRSIRLTPFLAARAPGRASSRGAPRLRVSSGAALIPPVLLPAYAGVLYSGMNDAERGINSHVRPIQNARPGA